MRRQAIAGFTLIELMVTIAVLAVIVAIAIPSFQGVINNNRLTSAVNEGAALVQTARMEAVRLNRAVVVCASPTPDATPVNCNTTGARGLVAYVGGGGATIRRVSVPANVSLHFSPAFGTGIVFRPDGFAHVGPGTGPMLNAVVGFCIATTQPPENVRRLGLASGSRVTTMRHNGTGSCANAASANTL